MNMVSNRIFLIQSFHGLFDDGSVMRSCGTCIR